ncbi:MAG: hypothetical protein PHH26_06210, partial [Candidatus Thermoplasmatota archaeon]|nr:hypothetical protein [Candidatus Thermoplasmatota archaeon]
KNSIQVPDWRYCSNGDCWNYSCRDFSGDFAVKKGFKRNINLTSVATMENSELYAEVSGCAPYKAKTVDLIQGLERFKTGSILQFFSTTIGLLGAVLVLTKIPPSVLVFVYIGSIVMAFIAYICFFTSTDFFKKYDPTRLKIGRTGMLIAIIGFSTITSGAIGVILTIGTSVFTDLATGNATTFFEALSDPTIVTLIWILLVFIAGAIVYLIGYIMFIVFIFRLGDINGASNNIRTGGILLVIGMIIAMIPVTAISFTATILICVAWFLMLIGVGSTSLALQFPSSSPPKKTE